MSNYTGGGRNYARRRHGDTVSRTHKQHFSKFSSRGFLPTANPETPKASDTFQIELSHAKNASITPLTRSTASASTTRIDAVRPDWMNRLEPEKPRRSRVLDALEALDENAKRDRIKRLLKDSDLMGLPPVSSHAHAPTITSANKRLRDDDDLLPPEPFKKPKLAPSPDLTFSSHDSSLEASVRSFEGLSQSMHSQNADTWDFSADAVEVDDFGDMPSYSQSQQDDEILSFSSTPLDAISQSSFVHSFQSNGRHEAIATLDQSLTPQMSSSTSTQSSFLSKVGSIDKLAEVEHPFHVKEAGAWPDFGLSEERLRLPSDKSGIGGPLKRWVGDGVHSDWEEDLRSFHYIQEQEEEEVPAEGMTWAHRPYEDHLPLLLDDGFDGPDVPQDGLDLQTIQESESSPTDFKVLSNAPITVQEEPLQDYVATNRSISEEANRPSFVELEASPADPVLTQASQLLNTERESQEDVAFTLAPNLFDW